MKDSAQGMAVGTHAAGLPSIIESGDYYYMFYTRFIDARSNQ
jgi:hypothetical protein